MRRYSRYDYWFRHVLYPLYNRCVGRDLFGVLSQREQSQWLAADAIRALQLHKLRRVLVNAGQHVPFYRRRFQEIGFTSISHLVTYQPQPGQTDIVGQFLELGGRAQAPPGRLGDDQHGVHEIDGLQIIPLGQRVLPKPDVRGVRRLTRSIPA